MIIVGVMSAALCTACLPDAKKGNGITVSGADSAATKGLDTTAVAEEEHYSLDFTVKNLLVLLEHNDDYGRAEENGVTLTYEDSYDDGDVECLETVYGKDVQKVGKEVLGYQLKPTSPHGFYFKMILDTSTRGILAFASLQDAKSFIAATAKTKPFEFEGKTYYIHPKKVDGIKYLYIETPYGQGDYETRYVIYPLKQRNGFCEMEVEVYV